MEQDQRTIQVHQTINRKRKRKRRRMINFIGTLSADIITDILSRLPGDSVVQCRHVCKTWRELIDDPLRRIWSTFLPADITINILSRLPADSIIQSCRFVCKTWRALINHPSFAETHTRRLISLSSLYHMGTKSSASFFLYQYGSKNSKFHFVEFNDNMFFSKLREQQITNHPCSLRFRNVSPPYTSSCNGLVFTGSVLSSYVNSFFVCNPFTREYIHLSSSSSSSKQGFMVYGFGYHPCTNEYKVVSIHYKGSSASPGPGWVSVYTLGSGTWRNIGKIQYQLVRNRRPGLLANGALHWMNKDDNKKIVSFDLADEKFRIVPSPPSMLSPNDIVDQLGVLEGCLCVTRSDETRYQSPKEIWVLNHHSNDNVNMIVNPEESRLWTKMEFSIPWKESNSLVAEPLVILKGGKVLLRDKDGLVSYDPNTKNFNKYNLEGYFNWFMWFDIIPYTKSFVSLKALGEKDVKSFGYLKPCSRKG